MTSHTLTYQLTEAQFMRACRQLWAHRAIGTTGNQVAGGLLSMFAVFMLLQGVPGWLPVIVLILGLGILLLDFARTRLWRRYFQQAPRFQSPITTTFAPSGLQVVSAVGKNDLPWSSFGNHVLTPDFFILMIDQRQFSVIPRAACADADTERAVENLIKDHLRPLSRRWL